jgi:hypothetical protein
VDLYLHSPIRLHSAVLSYLSTGTTFARLAVPGGVQWPYEAERVWMLPLFLAHVTLRESYAPVKNRTQSLDVRTSHLHCDCCGHLLSVALAGLTTERRLEWCRILVHSFVTKHSYFSKVVFNV